MQISHGLVVRSHKMEIRKKLEEPDEDLLALAIVDLRERFESTSKEVFLPFPVPLSGEIRVTVPKQGDKRKIVDLSERNARFYRQERFKQIKITDPDRHVRRLMDQMRRDLRLPEPPGHIECFDNSNIQGSNPVAACFMFRDGKPAKKEYRHFNIKTVSGPDDFASMTEVVFRRYRRLVEEGESLPQLIVIDGGKGQLSAALKSLEKLGLRGRISIIGIAKRLEEMQALHRKIDLQIPVAYHLAPEPRDNDKIVGTLTAGSMVVNATGLGKDRPGSPLTRTLAGFTSRWTILRRWA